ncbi:MAG: hypothetical protein ACOX5Q_06870 [Bacillota bacterium]|jgi:hypothetical protein
MNVEHGRADVLAEREHDLVLVPSQFPDEHSHPSTVPVRVAPSLFLPLSVTIVFMIFMMTFTLSRLRRMEYTLKERGAM